MSIREARLKTGMNQKECAAFLGIPRRTLQNWEGGVNQCPEYVERLLVEKLVNMDSSINIVVTDSTVTIDGQEFSIIDGKVSVDAIRLIQSKIGRKK